MQISLHGITKSFGKNIVIQKTDLIMPAGAFTTLLGPSGCGKTTLLRMLAGLETPDRGDIYFGDLCMFSAANKINIPPEERRLGFVFQDFALWPHMTVYENVAFGLRAAKQTKHLDGKVKAALAAVQLNDFANRYPHQLSGGQQQRVAFARAIVIEPKCILFDEPLSALDALLREEMRLELKSFVAKLGITAVFVTHDQTEAMSMSDYIAVMCNGTVQQFASPEEIYRHPSTKFVADFIGQSNWLDHCRMIRPEWVYLHDRPGMIRRDMRVRTVRFLGGNYSVRVRNESTDWIINSPTKPTVDDMITVYIDPQKIHTIAN